MINNVVIEGRLCKDVELRYTQSNNMPVASFTVAISRDYVKQGEERQTDFIPVVAWNKTAEFVSKYFQKGSLIAIVGKIQSRNWEDEEGKKHNVLEVYADSVSFVETKKDSKPKEENQNEITYEDGTKRVFEDEEDNLPF